MANPFTVVIAGVPELARALEGTALFSRVVHVDSTSGLRDVLQSKTLTPGVDDKVFIFADTLPVNTPQSLPFLIGKLTTMRARVIILGTTAAGQVLIRECPGAGLLEAPIYVNTVLGSIAGLPGVAGVAPVSDVANILVVGSDAGVTAQPVAAAQVPAFDDAPANPFGQAPAAPANPFGQAPAAPANPFGQAPAAPANPFGQSQPPSATTSPAFSEASATQSNYPVPAAQPHMPAAPFGQSPGTPQPANPFGQAPAVPSGAFGQAPAVYEQPDAPRRRNTLSQMSPGGNQFTGPSDVAAYGSSQQQGRRGWVITVTAPKGGTGKSSLSLNMAAYLGLRLRGTGKNVCIVDANIQQADTGKYLNAYTPNVEDLLRDPSAIHPERVMNYLLHKPQLNLSALLGPATPDTANPVHFTGRRYEQILHALKPNFDYIIIDTPVAEFYHDMFKVFALPNADFICVAVTPNLTTLVNADMWLRQITAPKSANGMGIDEARIGVTLNRAEDGIGCSEDEVRQNLAEWRYLGAIPETKEWKLANNFGELVVTKNYHELNEAFARVLSQATGESWLIDGMSLESGSSKPQSKVKGLFRRKKG